MSSDPDYGCSVALDSNVMFFWNVLMEAPAGRRLEEAADGFYPALEAQLEITGGRGWAAVGFSSDGLMVGSEAIICVGDQLPRKYNLGGKESGDVQQMEESRQTLLDTSSEDMTGGSRMCRFTKSLKEEGELEIQGMGDSWGTMIFASGDSSSLGYHGRDTKGTFNIDFASGAFSEKNIKSVRSNAIKTHGPFT